MRIVVTVPREERWQRRHEDLAWLADRWGRVSLRIGDDLGRWAANQRQFYWRGRLSRERIEQLEALGGTGSDAGAGSGHEPA